MRAKLRAVSVIPSYEPKAEGDDSPGVVTQERVTFCGVSRSTSYPEDGSDEDNTYAKFSPSVSLDITIANPNLFGAVAQGDEFYVDFSRALPVEGGSGKVPQAADIGLSFGKAIDALKEGKRVARAGWNGRGMFVYLVPAASYPVQTGAAKAHFGEGSMVPYNAYLALKGVDDTVSTWAPSGSDALAEDWEILDEPVADREVIDCPAGPLI
jgi:hypothetical protein